MKSSCAWPRRELLGVAPSGRTGEAAVTSGGFRSDHDPQGFFALSERSSTPDLLAAIDTPFQL